MISKSKIFIDSNILVYILDNDQLEKQKKAKKVLQTIVSSQYGVVSTQVLQETFVSAVKKLNIDPIHAKGFLQRLPFHQTVTITSDLVFQAIDCSVLNQLSFWDALIMASAASANCRELWTEDLNDGQRILGVTIRNPF